MLLQKRQLEGPIVSSEVLPAEPIAGKNLLQRRTAEDKAAGAAGIQLQGRDPRSPRVKPGTVPFAGLFGNGAGGSDPHRRRPPVNCARFYVDAKVPGAFQLAQDAGNCGGILDEYGLDIQLPGEVQSLRVGRGSAECFPQRI